MADDDGVADEFEQGRKHGFDRGSVVHHHLRDAGQHGDTGWDPAARIDQRLEGAKGGPSPELDGPDLGDCTGRGSGPRRFEVDHAEGDIRQRRAEVVERSLDRSGM